MPPQQGDPAFPGRCEAPRVPPRRERGGPGRAGGAKGRGIKCVLVGEGAVGKTSLVVSYTTNGYPTEYIPTACDNFLAVVSLDGRPVRLQLCDTAGPDEFDRLRPLCYTNADIFLLCFSVVSPSSFQNVTEKWVPEIRRHCPKAPIILVGTQSDLREDVKVLIELDKCKEKPVPEEAAKLCAEEIKAALLHRVLGPDAEEPQGGLRRGHPGRHPVLGHPAAAKEAQEQDSGQNEDSLQVLVEEILLLRMMLARPWGGLETKSVSEALSAARTPRATGRRHREPCAYPGRPSPSVYPSCLSFSSRSSELRDETRLQRILGVT